MRLTPVDILANWYNDETLPWSAQKAVNCLAETAEVGGTRSVAKTKGLPGLTLLANLETGAPIRGAEDVEGTLFVVSGTSLFQINPDNSFTNRGNIPGVSLVSMAHNKQGGTTAANELVIANGLSGYVYNTDTTVLSQITDDAFPGATTFDYVDGYISFTDPEGRFWGHSALNQATQYSSIDRYDAESAPDKIVSHIVSHREVMVFGTRTTEFFRNTGAATGTFQRVDGTEMEVGIAAPLARARLDNTVYWLGHDGIVYRLAGHSPQRVSNRPIEQAISEFNPANAFAHTWEDRGHKVFYLTFPDGLTFGFDVATSLWHARETYGLDRWGVNTTTRWNGLWVAGDYSNGKLYRLNWDDYTEGGRPLVMECQPGVTHADGNDVLCPYVELFMDTGQSPNPADLDELAISGNAPDTLEDVPYSFAYSATGGFGIYTFSFTGSIPTGLTLSPSGVLSGIPTSTGVFNFTVTVTDSLADTASVPDTVNVSFAPNLLLARSNGVSLRSGLTSAFTEIQSIVTTGGAVLDVALNNGATYAALCQTNAPFFQMFKRNSVGAYIDDSVNVSPVPASSVQAACFTPDGNYLALRLGATEMRLYKFNGTTYTQVSSVTSSNVAGHMSWDPTGTYIATGGAGNLGRIWTRTGDTLALTQGINLAGSSGGGTAWRGDKVVFSGTLRHAVYQMIAGTATLLDDINPPAAGNADIVWSPDGLFLFVSNVTAPFLTAFSWNGVTLTQLANPPQPAFSPTSVPTINMTRDGRFVSLTSSNAAGGTVVYERSGGTLTQLTLITYGLANSNSFATSTDYAP